MIIDTTETLNTYISAYNKIQKEFTGILETLRASIPDALTETIREAFGFLKPRLSRSLNHKVCRTIVLESVFHVDCHCGFIRNHTETKLRSIDNAFHLLDGKGPVKYPDDIITIIMKAMLDGKWECETPYFRLKWFLKRETMCLEILRNDLLAEFNRIGGGHKSRPVKAGKMQLADCSQENALKWWKQIKDKRIKMVEADQRRFEEYRTAPGYARM